MIRPLPVLALVLLSVKNPAHAADQPKSPASLPKTHPGWKIELVAEPPTLRYPSVITCAPDGRIFVAQDPCDMPGPSNAAIDSILCIHPDGHTTKFAEGLHAVFGLAYFDGKLYVHHCPDFSVFDDDNGIGKNRVDLFKTNPNPTMDGKGFNDHIPSNMRLAMDGYFYMSTGDKGIFNCVGKDGSKVELHGGGVIRFRPDGTHLEVFATGTRNHLDVALNSEDEIFTYDNTDDGNGWWTRVTHIVDGGYYGYPYDYQHDPTFGVTAPSKETLSAAERNAPDHPKERNPKFLPAMTDYGGGSPTASICYNEDALPDEYRGNLFLSEWGRRQLLRLRLSRDGATYKVDERVQHDGDDFLVSEKASGKREFRPVGLAWSPDGLSLYIADWNFGGWRAPETAGRLLKVTYTGKSLAAPKPAWFVPAATGKKFDATDEELIEGLKHPAQSVRMVAQRRLAERGQKVVPLLKKLLTDTKAPAHARWHTIWTLDAIDEGKSAQKEIIALAVEEKELTVRAQAIRQLGTRGVTTMEALKMMIASLHEPDATTRLRAAIALGRTGQQPEKYEDAELLMGIAEQLDIAFTDKDQLVNFSTIVALRRIATRIPIVWKFIGMTAGGAWYYGEHVDARVVQRGAFLALSEAYHKIAVDELKELATTHVYGDHTQIAAIRTLAELHRQRPPWNGKWWGTQPVKGTPEPKTVEWEATPIVRDAIIHVLQYEWKPETLRAAAEAVQTTSNTDAAPQLRKIFTQQTDVDLKKSILLALGALKDNAAAPLVTGILDDPAKNAALLPDAIKAAGQIGDKASLDALAKLADTATDIDTITHALEAIGNIHQVAAVAVPAKLLAHRDAKVRQAASSALANIGGNAPLDAILPLFDDPDFNVRQIAIATAGALKNKRALPKLLTLSTIDAVRADATLALAKIPDVQALDVYLDGLASKENRVRDESRKAIESFRDKALPVIEARHAKTPFTGQTLRELQRAFDRDATARKGLLFAGEQKPSSVEEYDKFAMKHDGDAKKGRKLFEETAGCVLCHAINGKGGQIGPELTGIGTKYQRATLIESVLYPSKQIFDGYRSTVITTKGGDTLTGFIRDETPDGFAVLDAAGEKHPLKKDQIAKREESNVSLMPEGLQAAMSLADFADLIAYLESQKEKPAAKK